jgi:hypothetical protein
MYWMLEKHLSVLLSVSLESLVGFLLRYVVNPAVLHIVYAAATIDQFVERKLTIRKVAVGKHNALLLLLRATAAQAPLIVLLVLTVSYQM